MVHLITGYAGQGHVTAADDALYHAGVCGTGKYVMRTGTMFKATIETNNLIRIGSGDLINQGRHINIPINDTETVTIENGTQGESRKDIIAIRYIQDTMTGVESAKLIVLKGTPITNGQQAELPSMISGNLYNGDNIDDFPLYQVSLKNLEVTAVTPMYSLLPQLSGLIDMIYPVGSIYMSNKSTNPASIFGGTWEQIQGKFLYAADKEHQAGSTGGEEYVSLNESQIPSHTHTGSPHAHSIPSHNHDVSVAKSGEHAHFVSRSKNAASGTARYAAQGEITEDSHGTDRNGAHTHEVTVKGSGKLNTEEAGTGNTGSTGGGQAHNNMPPYLSVYVWIRTK